MFKRLILGLVTVAAAFGGMTASGAATPVMAVSGDAGMVSETVAVSSVQTNLFGQVNTDDKGSGIMTILKLIVAILFYGIGAVAVIGVVVAGIIYLTARDNEAQATKARTRLVEIGLGLVVWAMLFTLLNWLIPGFTGLNLF